MKKKQTQTQRVLSLLQRPEGACMISFIHHGVLRYSARIHELRADGWIIATDPCDRTDHTGHVSYSIDTASMLELA